MPDLRSVMTDLLNKGVGRGTGVRGCLGVSAAVDAKRAGDQAQPLPTKHQRCNRFHRWGPRGRPLAAPKQPGRTSKAPPSATLAS
ncbi:hypothetical protein PG995_007674 [Apiospora arundinis]